MGLWGNCLPSFTKHPEPLAESQKQKLKLPTNKIWLCNKYLENCDEVSSEGLIKVENFYRQSTMLLLVLLSATWCSGEPVGGQSLGATRVKEHQPFHDSKPWIPSPSQPVHLSRQVTVQCVIELLWHDQKQQFNNVNYAWAV